MICTVLYITSRHRLSHISNKSKYHQNELRYGKTVKAIIYHFQEILEMK